MAASVVYVGKPLPEKVRGEVESLGPVVCWSEEPGQSPIQSEIDRVERILSRAVDPAENPTQWVVVYNGHPFVAAKLIERGYSVYVPTLDQQGHVVGIHHVTPLPVQVNGQRSHADAPLVVCVTHQKSVRPLRLGRSGRTYSVHSVTGCTEYGELYSLAGSGVLILGMDLHPEEILRVLLSRKIGRGHQPRLLVQTSSDVMEFV